MKTNTTLGAILRDADAMHKEIHALLEAIRTETKATVEAIRADLRDFHGRLCAIEERNKIKGA